MSLSCELAGMISGADPRTSSGPAATAAALTEPALAKAGAGHMTAPNPICPYALFPLAPQGPSTHDDCGRAQFLHTLLRGGDDSI